MKISASHNCPSRPLALMTHLLSFWLHVDEIVHGKAIITAQVSGGKALGLWNDPTMFSFWFCGECSFPRIIGVAKVNEQRSLINPGLRFNARVGR